MSPISAVRPRLFRVPLDEPLVDAKHGVHSHFELVTVEIGLDDGGAGVGYTYTGGKGGAAVLAMLRHDLAPFLLGRDPDPVEDLYEEMQEHVHYVGRGGVASFAISAVDIALWDLRGKRAGRSLAAMAGGQADRCRAYRGGIDLGYDTPRLVESVKAHLADGFEAVKIKVGRPHLDEDVERVAAIRAAIGPNVALMVDANYAFSLEAAIEAARAFAPFDLVWFEEPIAPDDFAGYGRIVDATGAALAMGENLHTIYEFQHAIERSKLAFLQPDASNCGGVTGWLAACRLGEAAGVTVCSHGMQELHVSLLSGRGGAGLLEVHSFPIDHYTTRPVRLENGKVVAPAEPGSGVTFVWERLEPFEAEI